MENSILSIEFLNLPIERIFSLLNLVAFTAVSKEWFWFLSVFNPIGHFCKYWDSLAPSRLFYDLRWDLDCFWTSATPSDWDIVFETLQPAQWDPWENLQNDRFLHTMEVYFLRKKKWFWQRWEINIYPVVPWICCNVLTKPIIDFFFKQYESGDWYHDSELLPSQFLCQVQPCLIVSESFCYLMAI